MYFLIFHKEEELLYQGELSDVGSESPGTPPRSRRRLTYG